MEKINLKKCKSILEKDGSSYTDQDILEIREYLYMFAEMDYAVYEKQKKRDLEFQIEKEKTKRGQEKCSPCEIPKFTT